MAYEPTEHEVHAARAAVNDAVGLDLTDAQVREILSDPKVASNLSLGGVDTCTREAMAEVLSLRILGRSWPTYGDKVGFAAFSAEFVRVAREKGYRVVG